MDLRADEAAVKVVGRYDARVAHVQTIGTLYNDKQDVGAGSGLLIGETLIVTNNHIIPEENNYKRLDILVRLRSHSNQPTSAKVLARDSKRDLALLQLESPALNVSDKRCPMPVVVRPAQAPTGTTVFVMGFPLNQDLSLSGGLISNQGDPPRETRWQTDTVMNPGNSGGPVFEDHGILVGIAVAGEVSWTFGGQTRSVNGVNFFIPTAELIASSVFHHIAQISEDKRCWIEARDLLVDAGAVITADGVPKNPVSPPPVGPDKLSRTYTVSQTKDDHPIVAAPHSRNYQSHFQAEPGYRIVDCTPRAESANHEHDLTCNIQAGGTSATLSYRLESGPAYDRWRGWWAGYVTLNQERKQ